MVEILENGVKAQTSHGVMHIGSRSCMDQANCTVPSDFLCQASAWAARACTTVFIALGEKVVAALAVGDAIHPDVRQSLAQLRNWGWDIQMLTGDEPAVAEQVALAVGLERACLHAGVTPEQKLNAVKQRTGDVTTVMVGDGVNDAAALAAADVGISVSGGAEASMAAADVYLAKPGLTGLVELIASARRSRAVVVQNLVLSLTYNTIAVGLAAAGLVTPLLAAVLMPLSSATVLALAMKGQTRRAKVRSTTKEFSR